MRPSGAVLAGALPSLHALVSSPEAVQPRPFICQAALPAFGAREDARVLARILARFRARSIKRLATLCARVHARAFARAPCPHPGPSRNRCGSTCSLRARGPSSADETPQVISVVPTRRQYLHSSDAEGMETLDYTGRRELDEIPAGAHTLRDKLLASDAFILASPEYNASMPGTIKNLIDWVSRFSPQPFDGKHGLLLSASPSLGGGNRGLWSLRVPLEHLGARIFPDMFSLATAHKAFDGDRIADPTLEARFEKNVQAFLSLSEAAKNYPCIKRAWWSSSVSRPA
jgi:NAD(P)H-dependent FMN reductase